MSDLRERAAQFWLRVPEFTGRYPGDLPAERLAGEFKAIRQQALSEAAEVVRKFEPPVLTGDWDGNVEMTDLTEELVKLATQIESLGAAENAGEE